MKIQILAAAALLASLLAGLPSARAQAPAVPASVQPPSPPPQFQPLLPPQVLPPNQLPPAAPVSAPAVTGDATTAPAPAAAGQPAALATNAPPPIADLQGSLAIQTKLRQSSAMPAIDESLFFTPWQHALLQEAKRGFLTRPPSAMQKAGGGNELQSMAIRELSLGGIVYRAPKDWTIYFNNQRVTPNALPEQVMDLKVAGDHIDLKWFDTATSLIFPIRLHAHERFNLDARMFLPGTGVSVPATATP